MQERGQLLHHRQRSPPRHRQHRPLLKRSRDEGMLGSVSSRQF